MLTLYNLSVFLIAKFIQLASLFHPKARAFVTGRKGVLNSIGKALDGNSAPVVWLHSASLGEFEQGRPVIEALKREFPGIRIFLTFFSPSGFEVRKDYPNADYVFYLPWDTKRNAKRLIAAVKPVLAIFVKYEFWFHYSRMLKKNNVPLLSVSSIFRRDQLFFSRLGSLPRRTLKNFSHFFVQNLESIRLLHTISQYNCSLAGDTRFDRVYSVVQHNEPIAIAEAFKNHEKTMVIGSCWQEDLDVLAPFINEGRLKFIVAPHELSETFIAEFEKSLQVRSIRYSQAEGKSLEEFTVLIIDNIGLLSRLYRYGEFAFIGGAFGKGLHNILEAACYGIPVFFGDRNYEKFGEAMDLINRGGAFAVSDYKDLKVKYELVNTPETFLLACEVTRQYIEENLGATEKIINYCRPVLEEKT